jgi:hypothetical protein
MIDDRPLDYSDGELTYTILVQSYCFSRTTNPSIRLALIKRNSTARILMYLCTSQSQLQVATGVARCENCILLPVSVRSIAHE